ncbi:FAD-dependent oxidoreductase [Mangrovactinospora gilvigrisea]|uniref:FAD-dependent oxidoreductase n=1 Tax=Mangrovactinospora gilvigrisea TaxID=1428644 RepID=A0A1J7C9Y1_9ACTN|nr:TIGR03364 family FAD-dependent oxidoreductase [Mangrovactinospora gilvigrisea]OIV38336.1 FAD-dependent oxidoreductase [Mangrovactinospora gilvigrisea]
MRIAVVGAGALGTMHAWHAVARGHEVVHLEREPQARGASVRNFGFVQVGCRAEGEELAAARRGRELWEEIGAAVPGVGFRPCGSLVPVRTDAELAVAKALVGRHDAADRGFALLDADEARTRNPALRGALRAALFAERDAVVEPRRAVRAVQEHLAGSGRYTFLGGREVVEAAGGTLRDDRGERHHADAAVLCTGAWLGGLVRDLAPDLPVRRVRLQMMQTEPLGEDFGTAVADTDTFRFYPGYAGPWTDALNAEQPQHPTAASWGMQTLIVQRADGGLTIGDTHAYDEPFDFDLDEAPYAHLTEVAEALLGRPLPPVRRRWAGVYAQGLDPRPVVQRRRVDDRTWLVTGPGGRGMSCSPSIGETTLDEMGL